MRLSEKAASNIQSWPRWMQKNLEPQTIKLSTKAAAKASQGKSK